jgi:hypothetical protein
VTVRGLGPCCDTRRLRQQWLRSVSFARSKPAFAQRSSDQSEDIF